MSSKTYLMTVLPTEKLFRIFEDDRLYFKADFWHFIAHVLSRAKENKYCFLALLISYFSFS